ASHRFPSFIAKAGICDIRYIHRYFQTHQGIWQLGLTSPGGAGRNKTLNQSDFLDIQILLPPFKEQERIADIIDTWDEAIALTNALIKALQQRKKGLMQKLLTGEIRFPGFDDAWEEVRIDDVARVNPPKPKNLDENTVVSFVGMADVSEDARLTTKESRPYSEVSSGFTPFRDMDILIAKITPCLENGKGALVNGLDNGLGFGSTEFHVVRAKAEKTFPEFLYYHTVSHNFRGRGELNMVGSAGQKRVPTDYVRAYRFPIPTLAEQKKIIASLSDADDGINLYKLYVTELQQQKKGLMQQLLTGQVQVKGMDYVRVLHK
ncbi:MAG: restriction endonuclease subunit S, partial [Anaerolineae bacterium]|nr:restriction endonuclease subunit S [Anaerolineae bacterium]